MKKIYIDEGLYYDVYKTKKRTIFAPSKDLKLVQRKILKWVKFLDSKMSVKSVAQIHCNQKWIMKLDIRDFYNSITKEQISEAVDCVKEVLGDVDFTWEEDMYELCTVLDKLPTGACTSPFFANYVMRQIDDSLKNQANYYGVRYSRFMDDMMFSSDEKYRLSLMELYVIEVLKENGFEINKEKIRYISNNKHQEVLGVLVNNKKTTLSKDKKRKYRSMFYNWLKAVKLKSYNNISTIGMLDIKTIIGHLAYIKSIDKSYYEKMVKYIYQNTRKFKITSAEEVRCLFKCLK